LIKYETCPLNKSLFIHYKTHKLQNQTQFHQMTNKYIFSKSQPDSNMYKCIISIEKSYKLSKHINKLHIIHKNTKKLTF
jgi:hypothetical protein